MTDPNPYIEIGRIAELLRGDDVAVGLGLTALDDHFLRYRASTYSFDALLEETLQRGNELAPTTVVEVVRRLLQFGQGQATNDPVVRAWHCVEHDPSSLAALIDSLLAHLGPRADGTMDEGDTVLALFERPSVTIEVLERVLTWAIEHRHQADLGLLLRTWLDRSPPETKAIELIERFYGSYRGEYDAPYLDYCLRSSALSGRLRSAIEACRRPPRT